jgi:hypothetical protein
LNFLLHRFLAARDLESSIAGIGAMLPDLWRMADRRVRPIAGTIQTPNDDRSELASILSGIEHHVQADRWFHSADVFVEGERLTLDRLRASRVDAPKLGLFAHIAWELCLDGALVRRDGLEETLGALRDGFYSVSGPPADNAVSLHHFDRVARTADERQEFDGTMGRLFSEIARGPWVAGYQSGAGVVRRIQGMRVRLGFSPFTDHDRERLGEVLEELGSHADQGLEELNTQEIRSSGRHTKNG